MKWNTSAGGQADACGSHAVVILLFRASITQGEKKKKKLTAVALYVQVLLPGGRKFFFLTSISQCYCKPLYHYTQSKH